MYAHADELGGYRVGRCLLVPMAAHPRRNGARRTQANTKIGAAQTKTRAISAGTQRQACHRVPAIAIPLHHPPGGIHSLALHPFSLTHFPSSHSHFDSHFSSLTLKKEQRIAFLRKENFDEHRKSY